MPTINIQGLSVGAQSANSFGASFTNPACTVIDNQDNWGRTLGAAEKYLRPTDANEYLVTTVADYRDVEVEFWSRRCWLYFRLTASGRALRVELNEDVGYITLTALQDLTTPPGLIEGGSGTDFDGQTWTLATFPGYVSTPALSRLWTFGVSGFDFYIKLSGVEVARIQQPYHALTGKVAIRGAVGDYGITNFTVTALTPATIYSDPPNAVFDPRDFGLKELHTTGSISASSAALTVASATGFAIGDQIIVEIGGESGTGARGTKGVGGTVPALSYADIAARDADTSQVDGKWCWVIDTGRTFYWDDTAVLWKRGTLPDFYWALALPYALTAEITNIVGNVLTLDTAATVAATGANVYYNNYPALTFYTTLEANIWEPRALDIPAGDYACHSDANTVFGCNGTERIEIRGQGIDATRIFAPNGVLPARIVFIGTTGCSVHDLEISGNFGDSGYRFVDGFPDGLGDPNWNYYQGVFFTNLAQDGTCYNVRAGDWPGSCIEFNHVSSGTCNNCQTFHSDPFRRYVANWTFQCSDAGGVSFTDCSFTCPGFHNAFETFRSDGVTYTRCHSTNGIASSNSSGNFLFDKMTVIMQAGCAEICNYIDSYGVSITAVNPYDNPVIQVNSNIDPPSASMILGGIIRNPTVIIEGPADDAGHTWSAMININFFNPNIQVIGDPPWTGRPCDAEHINGYLTGPNYDPLVTPSHVGALGVNSTGEATIVSGIRVVGVARDANISTGGQGGDIVQDCVADVISTSGVTLRNLTNAAWALICGGSGGQAIGGGFARAWSDFSKDNRHHQSRKSIRLERIQNSREYKKLDGRLAKLKAMLHDATRSERFIILRMINDLEEKLGSMEADVLAALQW